MDAGLISKLEALATRPWAGTVYRHMFGDLRADRENTRGARWNPPETPAIYCSLEKATAIAEGDHLIELQPTAPTVHRKVFTIAVRLSRVLDLSDWNLLLDLGIEPKVFADQDYHATQSVGGAAEWLGCDGLIVPSARITGLNLAIFPRNAEITAYFDVIEAAVVP